MLKGCWQFDRYNLNTPNDNNLDAADFKAMLASRAPEFIEDGEIDAKKFKAFFDKEFGSWETNVVSVFFDINNNGVVEADDIKAINKNFLKDVKTGLKECKKENSKDACKNDALLELYAQYIYVGLATGFYVDRETKEGRGEALKSISKLSETQGFKDIYSAGFTKEQFCGFVFPSEALKDVDAPVAGNICDKYDVLNQQTSDTPLHGGDIIKLMDTRKGEFMTNGKIDLTKMRAFLKNEFGVYAKEFFKAIDTKTNRDGLVEDEEMTAWIANLLKSIQSQQGTSQQGMPAKPTQEDMSRAEAQETTRQYIAYALGIYINMAINATRYYYYKNKQKPEGGNFGATPQFKEYFSKGIPQADFCATTKWLEGEVVKPSKDAALNIQDWSQVSDYNALISQALN